MPRNSDILAQVTTFLELGRPAAKMVPIIGENLEGAVDIAINICKHAQGIESNKNMSTDLSTHSAHCTVLVVNHAQKETTDTRTIADLCRVLEKIADSTIRRRKQSRIQRHINKDSDADEIKELKQQLDDAMKRFGLGSQMRTEEALTSIKSIVDDIRTFMTNVEANMKKVQHGVQNLEVGMQDIQEVALNVETDVRGARADIQEAVTDFKIVKERILTKDENDILTQLKPVLAARHDSAQAPPGCFEHTRENMLNTIFKWIGDPSSAHFIYWLSGLAGIGKTTIAKTVCDILDRQAGRKAAISFFISRRSAERRDPLAIIRNIAYQLARYIPGAAETICEALRHDPDITSRSMAELARRLIGDTLTAIAGNLQSPIVIVIDALDECDRHNGQQDAQRLLVKQLYSVLSPFRASVKLLITSRLERNIELEFGNMKHDAFKLHEIEKFVVSEDLRRFLQKAFRDIVEKRSLASLKNWPADPTIGEIVLRCGSLFIYASTIVKYVDNDHYNPLTRLDSFLATTRAMAPSSDSPYATVDELYLQVLITAIDDKGSHDAICKRMHTVLGAIVMLQEPLSVVALSELLVLDEVEVGIDVGKLSSVLLIPSSPSEAVRTFHPSFHDFLIDPARCGDRRFFVDSTLFHGLLSRYCLLLMIRLLKYDICNIGNPGLLNSEVEGLSSKIEKHIPPALEYACRFWADHLVLASTEDNELISALDDFVKGKLLNWLEVMSLKELLSSASTALKHARGWCAPLNSDTTEYLHDGVRIIGEFYPAISTASLHVYHSVVPFLPRRTLERLKDSVPVLSTVRTVSEQAEGWSSTMQVITGHGDYVRSVGFSVDGMRIVSGSDDKTVRVWDANTGASLFELTGHSNRVLSVAFSVDGTRIVSGSEDNTVRVWDANTGTSLTELTGHSNSVTSVAFSADGTRIVSGSVDDTVRVWDTNTGTSLTELAGHSKTIYSVAFSPDGTWVASGSADNTVHVWDVNTGAPLFKFMGHSDDVNSVAFSPNATRIVSGSDDKTVRIWNANTGTSLTELTGHSNSVTSVAFSADGTRIVSGSDDNTVRVWDANTGTSLFELTGHSSSVTSVAFSSDGTRIISGSEDNTVRVWDANTGTSLTELTGHNRTVYSVAFSPDGTWIASGSADTTVHVWNAKTGRSLFELTGHSNEVNSVTFSPDGTRIVSGSDDNTVRTWDTNTGAPLFELAGHSARVWSVAFSPDGTRIASGSGDNTVRIWNANTGTSLTELTGHGDPVTSVAFSADGTRIVSGSADKTVRVWDANTGTSLTELTGHSNRVLSVAFSSDGTHLVSRAIDESILWDSTPTGFLLHQPDTHRTNENQHVYLDNALPVVASIDKEGWLHVVEPSLGRLCWLSVNHRFDNGFTIPIASCRAMVAIGSDAGIVTILDISACLV